MPTRSFAYEAGQHDDPQSIQRARRLVELLLSHLGMLEPLLPTVESVPVAAVAAGRPRLVKLREALHLEPQANFTMLPGFGNLDAVQAGQVVAYLDGESVTVDRSGYILMPLYQAQGRDGFFIVDEISAAAAEKDSH